MVRFLRSSVVLCSCLLASLAGSPETVEAQSHRGSVRHSSHRVSRVRGHRHGSHRLHRGYVQRHIGHRDHPSTYYPTYSPGYRRYSNSHYSNSHYSGHSSHSERYSRCESYEYGTGYGGHSGYPYGMSYGYSGGYSGTGYSSGYSSGNGYGYHSTYGNHVAYTPWGATVYGRSHGGGYRARAYVAYGNRQWLQGPATYLSTKRAVPWRARLEQAIDDGLYDDAENAGANNVFENSEYDEESLEVEPAAPAEGTEADRDNEVPQAAPRESGKKRGRLEYRNQDQDSNQGSGASQRTRSRDGSSEPGQRSTRIKRLLTLASSGKRDASPAGSPTSKRGQLYYPVKGAKISPVAASRP